MAPTKRQRSRLPASAFAMPSKRKYPINTKARAKAALAYAARSSTDGNYAYIRAKVLKKYPSLKATAGTSRPKRGSVKRSAARGRSRGGRRSVTGTFGRAK